jgi:hypothetical protein
VLELEDLNRVMTDLGMEDDEKVDIDSIRSRFQSGESQEDESTGTETKAEETAP